MKKSVIRYFIIGIYFTASLMGTTHIHNDAQLHSDCAVCVIHSNLHSDTFPPPTDPVDSLECCYQSICSETTFFKTTLNKNFNANAPPFFS